MNIFFTSDTHFGHANVIKYSQRPFSDVEEMDEHLIEQWNSVVTPGDVVYHLGDFCFRGPAQAAKYLDRLKGVKHLIWGNHDNQDTRRSLGWTSSYPYQELKIGTDFIVLSHYAMKVWNKSHHRSYMLYGHSHALLPTERYSVDMGVDYPAWNFRPQTFDQIKAHLETMPQSPDRKYHNDV